MNCCDENELRKYVLQEYLDVVEQKNPGSATEHIKGVSGEISEALLQGGYTVPEVNTSVTLTRICAVMVCMRCIGEITSLMSSDSSSNNEWLPLQKLNTRSEKELDKIRAGQLDPFPGVSAATDNGISVSTAPQLFPRKLWEMF